ncbi:MAG: TAT-variant-translocated molybdopterin oxidoreductase [Bdellovibrionales bacterium]
MEKTQESQGEKAPSKYWLSLEQWRQDPEFLEFAEKEFRSSPLQEEEGKDGWARREFLKLMGASLALTSFGCMRRPAQKIVPYAKKPSEIIHGLSNYYSSSFVDQGESFGVIVTSRDGRPIKIEGNPDHPANQGGMSARSHAYILSLYDPERLSGPRRNLQNEKKTNRETVSVKYEDMDKAVVEQLKKGNVALLMGSSNSPSTMALVREFSAAYNVKNYSWDGMTYDDLLEGQQLSYGRAVLPKLRLDRCQMTVSLGRDFLGADPSRTANTKAFAVSRKPGKEMNKLVVFESLLSLTGSNADERYRIGANGELTVAMGLLHHLLVVKKLSRYAGDSAVTRALQSFADAESKLGLKSGTLARVADELAEKRGKSVVMASGFAQGETSLATQIAVNFLNSVLDNDGATIEHGRSAWNGLQGRSENLANLIADLTAGKVKTLIIHGCNPGYAAEGSGFSEAVKKAEMVIYTGDRIDETGVYADYMAPDHHSLENWDDMEAMPGVFTVQQPTIEPLYKTRAFQDALLLWTKASSGVSAKVKSANTWYDYLRENWRSQIYGANRGTKMAGQDFDAFWLDVLHSGAFETVSDRKSASSARAFNTSALSKITAPKESEGYALSLYATVGLGDGALANVAWLQEFPDPVTKICWDNYLTVSPHDAEKEKWREADLVKLKVAKKELEVPVHIQPGQADGVLGLAVGYGRTRAGRVANNVGRNAYSLRQWKDGRAVNSGLVATVAKTGKRGELACVQDHHSMEGRQIVVEATLAQFSKDPNANIHRHKMMTMWEEHKYPNQKWGMVVDLNSCTGCGSCVIACQSENNIPTVGKKLILKGREMHWIRIDRYYVGTPEDPGVVHQPIVCMHCDNAPCETVCPVMATIHSDEGTNDMIYNRCVGTRYCSNNCPYKVRRFNWFNFVKDVPKPLNYAMNPDVTVRARGVMEKCTFCIHRIRGVKSQAKLHDRQLKDGDVKTACQQSCPADAIVFGDLNDTESAVRKAFEQANAYELLEELNTKPAVRYLSKIRNTDELKGGGGHGHGHSDGNSGGEHHS